MSLKSILTRNRVLGLIGTGIGATMILLVTVGFGGDGMGGAVIAQHPYGQLIGFCLGAIIAGACTYLVFDGDDNGQ